MWWNCRSANNYKQRGWTVFRMGNNFFNKEIRKTGRRGSILSLVQLRGKLPIPIPIPTRGQDGDRKEASTYCGRTAQQWVGLREGCFDEFAALICGPCTTMRGHPKRGAASAGAEPDDGSTKREKTKQKRNSELNQPGICSALNLKNLTSASVSSPSLRKLCQLVLSSYSCFRFLLHRHHAEGWSDWGWGTRGRQGWEARRWGVGAACPCGGNR